MEDNENAIQKISAKYFAEYDIQQLLFLASQEGREFIDNEIKIRLLGNPPLLPGQELWERDYPQGKSTLAHSLKNYITRRAMCGYSFLGSAMFVEKDYPKCPKCLEIMNNSQKETQCPSSHH